MRSDLSPAGRLAESQALDLADTLRDIVDIADRLHHGDFALPNGRDLDLNAVTATLRRAELRLSNLRDACATLAGVPDTEDVSDAEGFESAMIGAFHRHFTVGDESAEHRLVAQDFGVGRAA